jgi:hypothetical protein
MPHHLRPTRSTLTNSAAVKLPLGDPLWKVFGIQDYRMATRPTFHLDVGGAGRKQEVTHITGPSSKCRRISQKARTYSARLIISAQIFKQSRLIYDLERQTNRGSSSNKRSLGRDLRRCSISLRNAQAEIKSCLCAIRI